MPDQSNAEGHLLDPRIVARYAELLEKLSDVDESDPEAAHIEADSLMVDFCEAIGASPVAHAFNRARSRVGFWYA